MSRVVSRAHLLLVCLGAATAACGAAFAECPSPLTGGVAPPDGPQAFTQERRLMGAGRPIISSGEASLEDGVVIWRVTTPIEIITRIAKDGVTQSIEGGPFEPVGETTGAGFSTQVGFAALLRADLDALEKSYRIEHGAGDEGEAWSFKLSPRDQQIARQISAIDVTGCTTINSVSVQQTNGDEILIAFNGPAG